MTISIKTFLAALAVAILSLSVVTAQPRTGAPPQQGQSIKGADIKGRAPVSKEILKVNLPKGQEATLSNGLRVIVLENHRVPTFTMQMVVLNGGLSDPADYHGLSSFTAALLREGTTTRKSKDIAEQTDTLGATLTATSGLANFTSTITTAGLVENFDQALGLFSDVILHPTFPQEEVDKYKARQLQQQQFQRSNPNFLAQERFVRTIYGHHAEARSRLRRLGERRRPANFDSHSWRSRRDADSTDKSSRVSADRFATGKSRY